MDTWYLPYQFDLSSDLHLLVRQVWLDGLQVPVDPLNFFIRSKDRYFIDIYLIFRMLKWFWKVLYYKIKYTLKYLYDSYFSGIKFYLKENKDGQNIGNFRQNEVGIKECI